MVGVALPLIDAGSFEAVLSNLQHAAVAVDASRQS
jgi:hypothetical protein